MMNRREALIAMMSALGLAAAEVYGAPSLLAGTATNDNSKTLVLSKDVLHLLEEVADTIIPTTADSPGAKAAGIAGFVQEIVSTYYAPEERRTLMQAAAKLAKRSRKMYSKHFVQLDQTQREELLTALEADNEADYYRMIKQLTVWGYFSSEAGSKQALRYVAIPGRYDGDVTIEPGTKAWANVAGV
jgi:hypothetical protein